MNRSVGGCSTHDTFVLLNLTLRYVLIILLFLLTEISVPTLHEYFS